MPGGTSAPSQPRHSSSRPKQLSRSPRLPTTLLSASVISDRSQPLHWAFPYLACFISPWSTVCDSRGQKDGACGHQTLPGPAEISQSLSWARRMGTSCGPEWPFPEKKNAPEPNHPVELRQPASCEKIKRNTRKPPSPGHPRLSLERRRFPTHWLSGVDRLVVG